MCNKGLWYYKLVVCICGGSFYEQLKFSLWVVCVEIIGWILQDWAVSKLCNILPI